MVNIIICFVVQSDTIDNYYNVTLKEVLTYKYILSLPWTARPDFIVKVDDDSYVNIPELWRVFMSSKTFPTHDLLVGYRWVDAPVQREGSAGDPRSRCPIYMYGGTKYPTYLSGAGHLNHDMLDPRIGSYGGPQENKTASTIN